jgi:hypothetical protein
MTNYIQKCHIIYVDLILAPFLHALDLIVGAGGDSPVRWQRDSPVDGKIWWIFMVREK